MPDTQSNVVPSLGFLALKVCSQFPLHTLAEKCTQPADLFNNKPLSDSVQYICLKPNFFIPSNISEPLVQYILKNHPDFYIELFTDTKRCRLSQLDLSVKSINCSLNQNAVEKLMMHPLSTLYLSECKFSLQTFSAIANCASTLQQLDLSFVSGFKGCLVLKELVNLVKLNLRGADIDFNRNHFKHIGNLVHLEWLDLSETPVKMILLEELRGLKNLKWLSLYNCTQLKNNARLVDLLLNFKKLVHLDISSNPSGSFYLDKSSKIVTSNTLAALAQLPMLMSLDISGSMGLKGDDMIPFQKREHKLSFLGLYETGLSFHSNVPADKVAGEANEEQILFVIETYYDRIKFISSAFRKLFSLVRDHLCSQLKRCMENIVKAMERFKNDYDIHIASTALLYHMTKEDDYANQDPLLRRVIVSAILTSMETFQHSFQLQKNSCLALTNYTFPAEVEFMYMRVVDAFLIALINHTDRYLQRTTLLLFNHLICHSTQSQKEDVGKRGAVHIILQIMNLRIQDNETLGEACIFYYHFCRSEVLITYCWTFLWNITDETADNCVEFFNRHGMQLFVDCLYRFPNSVELHKTMMGVMGNIAEVKLLRPLLMEEPIIDLFISRLQPEFDLEVRYNSAGILSNLLVEGESAWNHSYISRCCCMIKIIESVNSWDLRSRRNINYRSFKPLLSLLDHYETPAAQHWAIWAIASMASMYSTKYCRMIIEENGLEYVNRLLQSNLSPETNYFASIVIDACINY
uniref:Protein zer-1 homolog n=1 Tax=Hydra vulgaris TaxID=6087 RepID=T2MAI8_HYDVU